MSMSHFCRSVLIFQSSALQETPTLTVQKRNKIPYTFLARHLRCGSMGERGGERALRWECQSLRNLLGVKNFAPLLLFSACSEHPNKNSLSFPPFPQVGGPLLQNTTCFHQPLTYLYKYLCIYLCLLYNK